MKFIMPDLTHVFHSTVDGGPYTLAAIVATDDLQVAFASTNHVGDNTDWRHNHNVLATMWSTRSTCAGDYLMQGDKLFRVEERGFSHVNSLKDSAEHALETAYKWMKLRRSSWSS